MITIETTSQIKTCAREDQQATATPAQMHTDTDLNRVPEEVAKKIRLIERSFSTLQRIVPEIVTEHMINTLFDQFSQRYGQYTNKVAETIQYIRNNQERQNLFESRISCKLQGEMSQHSLANQIVVEEDGNMLLKAFQKKIIARAFCRRDRTFTAVQDQIFYSNEKVQITEEQYELFLGEIMMEAYGCLQDFLKNSCRRTLVTLSSPQYKKMLDKLSNCRLLFKQQISQVLFTIIKGLYELEMIVPIKEQEALHLYQALMIQVRGNQNIQTESNKPEKPVEVPKPIIASVHNVQTFKTRSMDTITRRSYPTKPPHPPVSQLDASWNEQYQQKFLNFYLEYANLHIVRKQMIQQYPDSQGCLSLSALRSKFGQIIRVAVRKIIYYVTNYGKDKPLKLTSLHDERIKLIMSNQHADDIRKILLEFYRQESYDQKFLIRLIKTINKFFENLEADPENAKKKQKGEQKLKEKEKNMERQSEVQDSEYMRWAKKTLRMDPEEASVEAAQSKAVKQETQIKKQEAAGSDKNQNDFPDNEVGDDECDVRANQWLSHQFR